MLEANVSTCIHAHWRRLRKYSMTMKELIHKTHRWVESRPKTVLIIALALSLAFQYSYMMSMPADQWFILNNGRYVVQHGFPYSDPFYVWGGSTVLENWLYAVIMYAAWAMVGGNQIGVFIVIDAIRLVICLLTWLIARRYAKGSVTAAFFSVVSMSLFLDAAYNLRPSSVSLLTALAASTLMLEWLKTRRAAWLIALIPMTIIAFNLHMAMGWYTILVPGCFMLADVILSGEKRLKTFFAYVAVVAGQVAGTFINPWGWRGVVFLPESTGAMTYKFNNVENNTLISCLSGEHGYCMDVMGFTIFSGFIALILSISGIAIAYDHMKTVKTDARTDENGDGAGISESDNMTEADRRFLKTILFGCIVMTIGFTVLAFGSARSWATMAMLSPFCIPLLVDGFKKAYIKILMCVVSMLLLMCFTAFEMIITGGLFIIDTQNESLSAIGSSAELVEEHVPAGVSVGTDGILGAKIGWNGHRVTNDMRPELIAANKLSELKVDRYKEYVDMQTSDDAARKFAKSLDGRVDWYVSFNYKGYSRLQKALIADGWHAVDHNDFVTLYKR